MVNTPHNPSGAVFGDGDVAALHALLQQHDLWLLSDEVYEHMVFDGARHESVLRHPELAARSFVVSSFGKTYHCTGWKLGYCVAPRALSAEFRKVHQYNTFCSFAPAQFAVAEMMRQHPEHHEDLPTFYAAKRDHFRGLPETTRLPDAAFCRWLTVEHGVAAIPLSPFYATPPPGQRLARLCFAKHPSTLEAAVQRLQRL